MQLYFSPGSISLAVHILLRELSIPFELVPTPTGDEAHQTESYLAINPLGRVPTVVDGAFSLTETVAIMRWLAMKTPERGFYPSDSNAASRGDEILSQLSTIAHPSYRMAIRPDRVARAELDDDTAALLRAAGRKTFLETLAAVEARLPDVGWSLGPNLTILDPYLAVMFLWARFIRAELAPFPRLSRIALTLLARESARDAIIAEGLVDGDGRPTPPARV